MKKAAKAVFFCCFGHMVKKARIGAGKFAENGLQKTIFFRISPVINAGTRQKRARHSVRTENIRIVTKPGAEVVVYSHFMKNLH